MCQKPIVGVDGCTAFGKVYHKECFKCCVCKKRIDGKFFEKGGKPYCAKDWEVSVQLEFAWFCNNPWQELKFTFFFFHSQKVTEECCVCKQPIKGDCIESGKKFYHPLCMRCIVCGEALRGQYFTYQGDPICEKDYKVTPNVIFINYSINKYIE